MAGFDPGLAGALLVAGFLGGGHCLGMCGGIVAIVAGGTRGRFRLIAAYNVGRVVSYGLAGALAGALGARFLAAGDWLPRFLLLVLAAVLMIGMGLYLIGVPHLLAPVEKVGARLWRHVEPLSRRFLPVRTGAQALSVGLLWGWLPCGLVYSALASALSSGSTVAGVFLMLAFGLGTLPLMLTASALANRWRQTLAHPRVRTVAGLTIAAYGIFSLWRAGQWASVV